MKHKRYSKKIKTMMTSVALLSSFATVATPVIMNTATVNAADTQVDTSSPQAFVAGIGSKAQKIAAKHNMYASVMIAQALVESGYGTSTLSQAPNYNLFGIKGTGTAGTIEMNTREDGSSGSYNINAGFRKYHSFDESLEDNANVISSNPIYTKAWRSNTKTYKDATAALQGTYATATNYADTLNGVIERYDLTRYDSKDYVATNNFTSSNDLSNAQLMDKYDVKPDYKVKKVTTKSDVLYKTTSSDSVWGIARQYKISIEQLEEWNPTLKSANNKLPDNLELKVGENTHVKEVAYRNVTEHHYDTHKVENGDSLWQISKDNKTSVDKLKKLNNYDDDYMLYAGTKVKTADHQKVVQKNLSDSEKAKIDKDALAKAKALQAADDAKNSSTDNNNSSNQSTNTSNAVNDTSDNLSNLDTTYTQSDESANVQNVTSLATKQIGKPYVWGANGPSSFDCSGLMQYVFKNAINVDLGRVTTQQENAGDQISVNQAKPGDLYFWGAKGSSYHVALALGNGKYLAAPRPGENVKVGDIQYFEPQFAVHVLK